MTNPSRTIDDLRRIMQALRHPETGCPWDVQQDFASIAPYTIEEAYEVADAIQRGDLADLRDELGDLLLQVVFHAEIASERAAFTFDDVVTAICVKMERRHPHVFADATVADAAAQTRAWEDFKDQERRAGGATSLMDHVPRGMAELQRAIKLQKRAARVGFDWTTPEPILEKLEEERLELQQAMAAADAAAMEDELGDLLFVITNLARRLGIDPASALRGANAKFERRFRAMEAMAGGREGLQRLTLGEMENLWQQVKERLEEAPAT